MSSPKILIVDFEEKSLEFLLDCLKDEEFRTVTATDGQAGLEKFESEKPDLVILEAMLPKIHGFDLCKKIAANGDNNVPVIITTGFYRGEYYKVEALKSFGASVFIEKPFKKQELLYAVHNLLKNGGDVVASAEERPLIKSPVQPIKKDGIIDISKKVDEMLKETLTEFGLDQKKKKTTTVPSIRRVAPVSGIPEKAKTSELDELVKISLKEIKEAVGEKTEASEVETKKEEIAENKGIKKIKRKKKPQQKSQQDKVEAQTIKPESKKKELPARVDPGEEKEPEDKAVEIFVQEEKLVDSDISDEKKPVHIPGLRYLALIKELPLKSYLKQGLKAMRRLKSIRIPKLRIVAPAAIAAFVILASGYYFLRPKKAVSYPQQKGQYMVSKSQQNMNLIPIVDPLTPDLISTDEPKQGIVEAVEANQEVSLEKQAEESTLPVPEEILSSKNTQGNQDKDQEEAIPPLIESSPSSSELVIPEFSPQIEELDLPVSPSLQDEEGPAFQDSQISSDENPVFDQQDPSENARSLTGEDTAENLPPGGSLSTEKVQPGDLVPIHLIDTQPIAIKKVNPRYPIQALNIEVDETVLLNVLVSENGDVLETQVLSANKNLFGFDTASEEAVKKWKFKPATKDGVKVRVWKIIAFKFKK